MTRLRVCVLCEDRAQERFFRRLLEPRHGRRIKFEVAPDGKNASTWVLKNYARLAREWIRKHPAENKALVVAIDGDNIGVAHRQRQLAEELVHASETEREEHERIAHCIPTWSIETWFVAASGEPVAESTTCKQRYTEAPPDVLQAAVTWFTTQNPDLSSAQHARAELRRLD